MKKIIWIATGGTISCKSGESGLRPYSSADSMNEMLIAVPHDILINAEIELQPLMNIDSSNISSYDIERIANAAADAAERCDGVVVTHGTDTMAYTSAMLAEALAAPPLPIILTGSQRPFYAENSDAPHNLAAAFAAACDKRFCGVYVAFGNCVIAGGLAHKAYSTNDNAFVSAGEYAAHISEDGVFTDVTAAPIHGKYVRRTEMIRNSERIANITVTPYTNASVFDDVRRSGVRGVVIEGYGLGGIPERLLPKIAALTADGVKVVLISQCLCGGVSMDVYEVGRRAVSAGVSGGGGMTLEAALARLCIEIGE